MQQFDIPEGYVARGYGAIVDESGKQWSEIVFVPDFGPENPYEDSNAIAIRMTLATYHYMVRYVAQNGIPDLDWTKLHHNMRSLMQEYDQEPAFTASSEQEPPFIVFSHNDTTVRIERGVDGFDLRVMVGHNGEPPQWWQDQMAFPSDLRKLADDIRSILFGASRNE